MHKGHSIEIHDSEDLGTGIKRILENLHNHSAKLVVAASRQHVSAHRLRVNLKTIRGILGLIRYCLGDSTYHQLNRSYSLISREVGVVRDYTSQIQLIENLRARIDDKELKAILWTSIGKLKQKRTEVYQRYIMDGKPYQLQKSILKSQESIWDMDISPNLDLLILKGLAKVYNKAYKTYKTEDVWENHEIYHYWRKQIKYLMYHLTVLKKPWPDYLQVYIVDLKKLGSLLGKLHDLHLFKDKIANGELLACNTRQLKKLECIIEERQKQIVNKTKILGARLFHEESASFISRLQRLWQNISK